MARNRYGSRDNCIFLEFSTVVGTDAIFYPDGRHNDTRVEIEIIDRVKDLRKHRPNLKLVGYSTKGDYSGKIYNFPQYVIDNANS